MIEKRYALLLILLVSILSISAVSATEDATDDFLTNDNDQELILEENINTDLDESSNFEEENLEDENAVKDFNALNYTINGNTADVIYLEDDYRYNTMLDKDFDLAQGIQINRALTIYGNGHKIVGDNVVSGTNSARIFRVTHSDVFFYDIVFVGGDASPDLYNSDGGAIHGECTVINCTFTENHAEGDGGAIFGNCTVINCTFNNNIANGNGGAIYNGNAINCEFSGNNASDYGGAIYNGNATDCTFNNNGALDEEGGAIYQGDATNCTFNYNFGSVGGGAISNGNAINCNFTSNLAIGRGGAIYNGNATNSNFNKNKAENGGAIYNGNATNSNFTENNASNGGAIYDGNAINCTFTENTNFGPGGSGGAIYQGNATNCTFKKNSAMGDGGAIYQGNAINSNFTNNTADQGGAISNGNAIDCTFSHNIVVTYGGAIYKGDATNSNFTQNSAMNNGGAIYQGTATNCTFNKNGAWDDGGAISNGNAINCTFTENTILNIGGSGGAISKGDATNSNFTQNSATEGGAISKGTATNCTFTGNTATEGGAMSESNATNSNFTENNADHGGAMSESNVTNSNFTQNSATEGGATYNGNAINCTFTENNAENGGATYNSTATNCTFNNNKATENGGATYNSTAITCNFTDNTAEHGDGSYKGTSLLCIYENNGYEETEIIPGLFLVYDFTSTYDSDEKLLFNLTANYTTYDGLNTTIKVYENDELVGTYYALSGDAGGWVVNLTPGVYKAIFSLDKYSGVVNYTSNIRISGSTTIIAKDLTTTYNSADEFVITLSSGKGKPVSNVNVTVDLNGVKTYTTDENGQINISTKGMPADIYIAKIEFDGYGEFEKSNATAKVTIHKNSPIVTITANNISIGDEAIINFTLTDEHNNNLSATLNVTVGDESYEIEVNDGQGSLTIENLEVNTYKVVANYEGDNNYNPSNSDIEFDVSKKATKIICNDMNVVAIDINVDGRIGEYFYLTLTDDEDNPLANKLVQIGFNGKTYNRTTDANGQAKIQVNLARANTYTFVVSFLDDENYTGSFELAKISVKKQTPQLVVSNKSYKASAKTKTLTATFKSAKGNAIANKKVTFTVNGKTYSAKTNSKGVASVKISLTKKGTYSVITKYAGDNTYAATSKKTTLKIK